MANDIKVGNVFTVTAASFIHSTPVHIQSIFVPAGTTETVAITADGQDIFALTASATISHLVQFPQGLRVNNLAVTKSSTTQKVYIYLK